MDPVQTLITQGGLGLMAGIFLWLYIQERKEHKETRTKHETVMEARRVDAKDTVDKVVEPLRGISQSIQMLSDKIEATKEQGRR